jgi:hypothetical protein
MIQTPPIRYHLPLGFFQHYAFGGTLQQIPSMGFCHLVSPTLSYHMCSRKWFVYELTFLVHHKDLGFHTGWTELG